jgi:hypothetical protein
MKMPDGDDITRKQQLVGGFPCLLSTTGLRERYRRNFSLDAEHFSAAH